MCDVLLRSCYVQQSLIDLTPIREAEFDEELSSSLMDIVRELCLEVRSIWLKSLLSIDFKLDFASRQCSIHIVYDEFGELSCQTCLERLYRVTDLSKNQKVTELSNSCPLVAETNKIYHFKSNWLPFRSNCTLFESNWTAFTSN